MNAGAASQPSFGPYKILSALDRGGAGVVYRAWDPRLEREVALKILRDRSDRDPERIVRFVAEARAASALNHPNIVTVFDAAVDGDTPYIVSELIDGRTLRDELRGGALPLKRLLDVAAQIADGLAAAHEAGIVHRDLKPENVMVTRTGRVKIVDFGLARPGALRALDATPTSDDGQTETEPGLRAGTVPYMSPEQARGATTDFFTDQFSFGLILYELALGRPAFRKDTPAATLDVIINGEPPSLKALDARAPVLFRWIVERCLAKEPRERYAVTADLYRDVRTLRDRVGELAPREVPSPQRLRRRTTAAGLTIGALAIGALLAAFAAGPSWSDGALHFVPLATDPGYEGFPAWSPDGQTIAYAAEVNDTLQIFTRQLSSSRPAQVTQAPYDCKHPFWSPDGKRLFYVSLARDRESIWAVGAAGGTPQVVVENANRGAISPDGRTLAFLRDEERPDIVGTSALWLSSPIGAEAKRSTTLDLRFVEGALAFSPDGRKLAICAIRRSTDAEATARGWQFWIVPQSGAPPYRRLESWVDAAPRVTSFAWLPDSRHVVLGVTSLNTPGSHLWMADLDGDRAWWLTRGPGSESYPSSSPDGEQVVFGAGEPDYDVVETPLTGNATRSLLATTRNESDPAWSGDGGLLAYVTDRSGQDEIWLHSRDDREGDRPLITQRDFGDDRTIMLSSPSFSPDGQRIAYQRNANKPIWPLRIWISQTAGGPPVPLLPPTNEGYQSAPTWSPDGQWIAYTQWRDQQWMLAKVRVGSGEGPVVLRTDGIANAAPSWSPRNDWITWETDRGFELVSPDGKNERQLSDDHWLAHAWSRDGSEILGIRETEQLRLSLVAVHAATGQARTIADLGPSPPVNNPVRGLAVNPSTPTIATSIVRLRGDIWLLDHLQWRERAARWHFRFASP
jgi:eukaryotic-like serine/threonine-protein kinase